jgi:hypothetical protein
VIGVMKLGCRELADVPRLTSDVKRVSPSSDSDSTSEHRPVLPVLLLTAPSLYLTLLFLQ